MLPLVVLAVGLGLSNGPASSASTAAVADDQVGAASGISNMARYVGASVAVAAIAMIFNAVTVNHQEAGESAGDALAAGLGRASLAMAIFSALGVALLALMLRRQQRRTEAPDRPRRGRRRDQPHDPQPVTARKGATCPLMNCATPSAG